jgi:hypothetical protein
MNCFRSLGRWDRGFESHSGYGGLVCVCVVLCLGSGLATGWSSVQGVLPAVKNGYGTEEEARAQQRAGRATHKWCHIKHFHDTHWLLKDSSIISAQEFENVILFPIIFVVFCVSGPLCVLHIRSTPFHTIIHKRHEIRRLKRNINLWIEK